MPNFLWLFSSFWLLWFWGQFTRLEKVGKVQKRTWWIYWCKISWTCLMFPTSSVVHGLAWLKSPSLGLAFKGPGLEKIQAKLSVGAQAQLGPAQSLGCSLGWEQGQGWQQRTTSQHGQLHMLWCCFSVTAPCPMELWRVIEEGEMELRRAAEQSNSEGEGDVHGWGQERWILWTIWHAVQCSAWPHPYPCQRRW